MSEKIHRGKIKTPPDPLVVKYLIAPGIKADIKYRYQAFLDCNKAHVLMLTKQKIVTQEVAAAILRCNNELAAMGDGPTFEVDPGREDFYFNIEAYLIEHVGIEIGGQQHTARSRNDLYATCARLGVRKAYFEICHIYNRMRQAILDVAAQNTDAVFAGYTHMQPSEPITFAHYCSAVLNAMQRDYRRIAHCYEALNICPLGGGSMGSTTWDIDRNYTAKLLGFDAPVDNSIDCVASRDFTTDILAVLSLSANTLSRFCQDLYVWATPDYGYVEVSDSCAVCSSIMPQKKNAFTLEHIKARAGHMHGYLMAMLACMKTIIYSHSKDTSVEATKNLRAAMLEMEGDFVLTELTVRTMSVKREVMLDHARRNFCTVTELANYLVRHDNISFREAHEIIAAVVGNMYDRGLTCAEIDRKAINEVSVPAFGFETKMTDELIREALDPVRIAEAKKVIGGTAKEEVAHQLDMIEEQLMKDKAVCAQRHEHLAKAKAELDALTDAMIAA